MQGLNKYLLVCAAFAVMLLFSCREDELTSTIFNNDSEDVLDPTSYTYGLDSFLVENYLKPYNMRFIYKMQDKGTDMNYNLVPATFEKSKQMAVLTKYLWTDVYDKIAGFNFLKKNGPRIIHLIGSPAYNPTSGTILLGLAEGGLKVSLFRVNELDVRSVDAASVDVLNEYYFKTMHHEFAHILHQTKIYPKTFNEFSYKDYNPLGWQDRHENITFSLGFVSPYAGSQTREDWVEVIANYIVKTDEWWEQTYAKAAKGWRQIDKSDPSKGVVDYEDVEVVDANGNVVIDPSTGQPQTERRIIQGSEDGVAGEVVIRQKLDMAKEWMLTEWGVSLDSLRKEVQYRQAHINIDSLLQQLHY